MSSACQKALGLVEIIHLVFSQIDTGQALARCASVNKQWHEQATPLLWHGSLRDDNHKYGPTAYDLRELVRTNKRRVIGHIRYLELDQNHPTHQWRDHSPGTYHALFKPQVWSDACYQWLSVDLGSENMDETSMATLLHPGLLVLNLFGGIYSDAFLESLRVSYLSAQCLMMPG